MKVVLTILVLLLTVISCFAGDLQFFREDLRFFLEETTFRIDGDYYFRNNSDKELKRILFYPFPQDSLYGEVYDVFARTADSTDVLGRISDKGAFFSVTISAGEEVALKVGYSHKLLGNKAEYILLTTRNWGIPFEEVNYSLEFPRILNMTEISLLPDSLKEDEKTYFLYWHNENFMPESNFIINFTKPE